MVIFFHFGRTRVLVYVITNSTTREESQPVTISKVTFRKPWKGILAERRCVQSQLSFSTDAAPQATTEQPDPLPGSPGLLKAALT